MYQMFFRASDVVGSLRRLADAADKMTKAGWPVWLTVAGLAFEPPGGGTAGEVCKRLKAIGVQLPFVRGEARTQAEVAEASGRLHALKMARGARAVLAEPERAPWALEKPGFVDELRGYVRRADELGLVDDGSIDDDFDRGLLDGRLCALSWVLGGEWDGFVSPPGE